MADFLTYDPIADLVHYPHPMAGYGKNEYGENLYRIIRAGSRKHLIGGKWPDGTCGYQWAPTYDFDGWVMERWNDATQYTAMSRREWDRKMLDPASGYLILGPYPARGEYALCHRFVLDVAQCNIGSIVGAVGQSLKNSFQDLRDFNGADYERDTRSRRGRIEDIITDTKPAFGHRPMSSMAGKQRIRNNKTRPELVSANELHAQRRMPVKPTFSAGHLKGK